MYFTNLWSKQKENDCYFKSENSMFNVSRDNIPVIVAKQFYLVYNLSKVKKNGVGWFSMHLYTN